MMLSTVDGEVPRGRKVGSKRHEEGEFTSFKVGEKDHNLACKKVLLVQGGLEGEQKCLTLINPSQKHKGDDVSLSKDMVFEEGVMVNLTYYSCPIV